MVATRGRRRSAEAVDPEPAGDVGVDRRAGDVLATLLDDEHVDVVERQTRQERSGGLEELRLGRTADLVGRQRLDIDDLTVGPLDRCHAAEEAARRPEQSDAGRQPAVHAVRSGGVELGGAWSLPEPDDRHLRQPALHRTVERRVRLDAVDRQDDVGGRRMAVEVEADRAGIVVMRGGDDGGLHGRSDLGPDGVLCDAEAGQRGELAVGGRTAMAAHRRNDERLGSELAQPGDRPPQHFDSAGQAAAAGANRDGRARGEPETGGHRRHGGRFDVVDGDAVGRRQHDLGQRRDDDVIERQCHAGCELLPTDRHTVGPSGPACSNQVRGLPQCGRGRTGLGRRHRGGRDRGGVVGGRAACRGGRVRGVHERRRPRSVLRCERCCRSGRG